MAACGIDNQPPVLLGPAVFFFYQYNETNWGWLESSRSCPLLNGDWAEVLPKIIRETTSTYARHAEDLQTQLDRAPKLIEAQKARTARQEEILHEAQETLKKLKVAIRGKKCSLRTVHQQIAKHQKQLQQAGGKKEYDALQMEIANGRKTCQRFEDEILEPMVRGG